MKLFHTQRFARLRATALWFIALFAVRPAFHAHMSGDAAYAYSPQATRPSTSGGPAGFPSPGYPDFGFMLKAGCRHLPASHLLFRKGPVGK